MYEMVAPEETFDVLTVGVNGEPLLRHDGSPPDVMRTRMQALTNAMLAVAATGEGKELRVEHVVGHGMYMRKLFIPKGTLLAGQIHLQGCMNIVAFGDITVLTEFGCARVTAGYSGKSPAGIQKIGHAHEDTVFINVFRTDETALEKIEAAIACTDRADGLIGVGKEFVCL